MDKDCIVTVSTDENTLIKTVLTINKFYYLNFYHFQCCFENTENGQAFLTVTKSFPFCKTKSGFTKGCLAGFCVCLKLYRHLKNCDESSKPVETVSP